MAYAVRRSKVISRFNPERFFVKHFFKTVFFIEQKHRSGLGAQSLNMPGAVLFLILAGEFVLAYVIVYVVVYADAGNQPVLLPALHDLAVQIELWLFILKKIAILNKAVEIYFARLIYAIIIQINIRRKIYFWL